MGATATGKWVNTRTPLAVRCAEGHDCWPRPQSVLAGRGVCASCGVRNGNLKRNRKPGPRAHTVVRDRPWKEEAEERFRMRLTELGATMVGQYVNNRTPTDVICSEGHQCSPRPDAITRGEGPCRLCVGKIWDTFYVVTGGDVVKFGVTSGDPSPRLRHHRYGGLPDRLFLRTGLPDGHARALELSVMQMLKREGHAPVRGHEYFHTSCTGRIMSLVLAALPE